MKISTNKPANGMGILSTTTLVFIILKLTDVIDWSWWWVLSPTLGGLALSLSLIAIMALCWEK